MHTGHNKNNWGCTMAQTFFGEVRTQLVRKAVGAFGALILAAVPAALVPMAAHAQGVEKTATRAGFAFADDAPVRIVVFRPNVSVGEQTTGGVVIPNADWTAAARDNLTKALDAHVGKMNFTMTMVPDQEGDVGATIVDYRSLFEAVAGAAMNHHMLVGSRLPTRRENFDWSLGKDIARLGGAYNADYALFMTTYDGYGSSGRKALQVVALLLTQSYVQSGIHIGYAGLVDLKTGDLIWLNADGQMGGDVRDVEQANKRIAQLLEDFPMRARELAAKKAAEATSKKSSKKK